MKLIDEDKILIKRLHELKGCTVLHQLIKEFPSKGCTWRNF